MAGDALGQHVAKSVYKVHLIAGELLHGPWDRQKLERRHLLLHRGPTIVAPPS